MVDVTMCCTHYRHGSVMEEGNVEMSKLQEKLEFLETAVEERDRELEIAKEKVQTLTDDLVASQGTVSS